jgi:AcrR family transcriptional regulator
MGIRERQERDRHEIRRAILDAARALFVQEGFANVSLRRIAERIEYSPATIYNYFPSKDEILCALAHEGFDLLAKFRPRPTLDRLEPLEAVRIVLRRIYEFSKEHPEYFALMFFERSIPRLAREHAHFESLLEHKRKLMSFLERHADGHTFPSALSPVAMFRVLSMGVFGVAALRLAGRVSDRAADRLAVDTVEAAIAGLRAGCPITYEAELDPAFPPPAAAAPAAPVTSAPRARSSRPRRAARPLRTAARARTPDRVR